MNHDELKIFGQALREIRIAHGFTQDELSEIAQVDRSYISEIENGHKAASILTVLSLSKALQIKPSEWLKIFEEKMKL